jgi:hypothetical protein
VASRVLALAVDPYVERHFGAGVGAGDQVAQLADRVDSLTIDFQQHITALLRPRQARHWPTCRHTGYDEALRFWYSDLAGDFRSHWFGGNSQPATRGASARHNLSADALRQLGGNRQANALIAATARQNRGVDAD